MLIKFSVSNFKCFDEPAELSLIQSSKIAEHDSHKMSFKDVNLLKYATIYGANSSGKSSLINAIDFMINVIRIGLFPNSLNLYCRNKKENINKPSYFEIQFSSKNKIYAYGFSALLHENIIESEWLYELQTKGKSKVIFEYDSKKNIDYKDAREYGLSEAELNRYQVYKNDFKKNGKKLFLTEMNANKIFSQDMKLYVFNDVYYSILDNFVVLKPDMSVISSIWFQDKTLESIGDIIKTLDTGIESLLFLNISLDDLSSRVSRDVYLRLKNSIDNVLHSGTASFGNITIDEGQMFITTVIDKKPVIYSLKIKHKNSSSQFDYAEESDGTKRIFWLLNLLINKKENTVILIDELEKSLHPKLTERFIQLFNEYHRDDNIQLILTTHESNIMKLDLFRRDEIWFIDKGEENSSKLYSLDRFKERYDKDIEKSYLEGRYGAVPIFDSFSFVKEDDGSN